MSRKYTLYSYSLLIFEYEVHDYQALDELNLTEELSLTEPFSTDLH